MRYDYTDHAAINNINCFLFFFFLIILKCLFCCVKDHTLNGSILCHVVGLFGIFGSCWCSDDGLQGGSDLVLTTAVHFFPTCTRYHLTLFRSFCWFIHAGFLISFFKQKLNDFIYLFSTYTETLLPCDVKLGRNEILSGCRIWVILHIWPKPSAVCRTKGSKSYVPQLNPDVGTSVEDTRLTLFW